MEEAIGAAGLIGEAVFLRGGGIVWMRKSWLKRRLKNVLGKV